MTDKCPECIAWTDRFADVIAELARKDELLRGAVDTLEVLARLGGGGQYGNSDGNRIAQAFLAIPEVVKAMVKVDCPQTVHEHQEE